MHFYMRLLTWGSLFNACFVGIGCGGVDSMHFLRSRSLQGVWLRDFLCICRAPGGKSSVCFYMLLHTWGGLFHSFFAGAEPSGEQLQF